MRDSALCRWPRWRVTLADRPAAGPRFARRPAAADAPPPAAEVPGPDGVRHDLVARVRAEIEAGVYDTPERWAAAEEALLQRFDGPS